MIKINGKLEDYDGKPKTVCTSLFADTKSEVSSMVLDDIIGFPKGHTLEAGSTVMTADADIAFLQSDGTWKWS